MTPLLLITVAFVLASALATFFYIQWTKQIDENKRLHDLVDEKNTHFHDAIVTVQRECDEATVQWN